MTEEFFRYIEENTDVRFKWDRIHAPNEVVNGTVYQVSSYMLPNLFPAEEDDEDDSLMEVFNTIIRFLNEWENTEYTLRIYDVRKETRLVFTNPVFSPLLRFYLIYTPTKRYLPKPRKFKLPTA